MRRKKNDENKKEEKVVMEHKDEKESMEANGMRRIGKRGGKEQESRWGAGGIDSVKSVHD